MVGWLYVRPDIVIRFGCFVSVPGYRQDGMVHISQIANHRVENIEEHYAIGDEVGAVGWLVGWLVGWELCCVLTGCGSMVHVPVVWLGKVRTRFFYCPSVW